jgi:TPR repeat protein
LDKLTTMKRKSSKSPPALRKHLSPFDTRNFINLIKNKSLEEIVEFCETFSQQNIVVSYFQTVALLDLKKASLKDLEKLLDYETSEPFEIFILAKINEKLSNHEKAFELYSLSASKGNAEAQNNLGYYFQYAEGGNIQDFDNAVYWYNLSAKQFNTSAMNNLGYCFKTGLGCEKNLQKAFSLFERASEAENASAQNNLGICYWKGEGCDVDITRALENFQKSALHGNLDAQYNIGAIFEEEFQNFDEAFDCFQFAFVNGHEGAEERMNRIESEGLTFHSHFKKNKMYIKLTHLNEFFSDISIYHSE